VTPEGEAQPIVLQYTELTGSLLIAFDPPSAPGAPERRSAPRNGTFSPTKEWPEGRPPFSHDPWGPCPTAHYKPCL